ncbi:MAG: hypothetical protein COA96_17350 [SAR86 cluster bacterium]|uniref:Polyketide cyclase n=1 Tax=SAR86 cluster bacterium TaxID=2030880 RepID=A0A2A5AFT4_9GAMM|nr:MAG: hypothetical protein COA96_17350 [SAR86 cluster bacterium]
MKRLLHTLLAVPVLLASAASFADPEYVSIDMEIDVSKSAEEVWASVGGYCDISEWLGLDCEYTSGDGDMGTVRALLGGRILEIMTAETELSYGYAQPAVEGQYYNLYHGFLEARPVSANSSKLLYTLVLDVSNLADQTAKDADVARRRGMFEGALAAMKEMAEK